MEKKKTWSSQENTTKYVQNLRESTNIGRESLDVIPQARDQSNKVPMNDTSICSPKFSISSKVRLFLSLQIHHIKIANFAVMMSIIIYFFKGEDVNLTNSL